MVEIVGRGVAKDRKRKLQTIANAKYVAVPKKWREWIKMKYGIEVEEVCPVYDSVLILCKSEEEAEKWAVILEEIQRVEEEEGIRIGEKQDG